MTRRPPVPVFQGDLFQHGHGFGGLLASLARKAIPMIAPVAKKYLLPAAKTIGKRLIKSGGQVAGDVILRKRNLKSSLRRRGSEFLQGEPKAKKRRSSSKKRRTHPHTLKRAKKDIFY